MNPNGIKIAKAYPNFCVPTETLLAPTDWNEELNPCHKCNANKTNETQYKPVRTGETNLCCNSEKYLVASNGFASTYL